MVMWWFEDAVIVVEVAEREARTLQCIKCKCKCSCPFDDLLGKLR